MNARPMVKIRASTSWKPMGMLRVVSAVAAERTHRYEPVSVRSWVP